MVAITNCRREDTNSSEKLLSSSSEKAKLALLKGISGLNFVGELTLPYYTKLRWVPFKMPFIKIDLIKNFLTKNCNFE